MENLSKEIEAEKIWEELLEGVNDKPKHKNPKKSGTKKLIEEIKEIARTNTEPTKVEFGTSGWRGTIGISHTIQNFIRVTEGLVEMVKTADKNLLKEIGVRNFAEFQKRGIIVGRDNRLMGEEFAESVIGTLQRHNIKVYYAGMAPTPEYSAAVVQLNAAMSINITPSHNPANYSGYKVNPADGGPSGENITKALEKCGNKFMNEIFEKPKVNWKKVKKINTAKLYLKHIKKYIPHIIDINKIKKYINSGELSLAIDFMHGATRERGEAFLNLSGKEPNVKLINTDDNILFHGVKPEPSAKNMIEVEKWLKKQKTKFKLGVLIDPDGDRIRFTNGITQVDMNNYGALAFYYLCDYKKLKGGVAKTIATSNFVNAIARGLKRELFETKVGFKYFRDYLKPSTPANKRVVCAFEESDGFSIGGANILEKDAFAALLLEIIRTTKTDLVEYLNNLKKEYGIYEAKKDAVEILGDLTKEQKAEIIAKMDKTFKEGEVLKIDEKCSKKIIKKFSGDGVKLEFEDRSNLLVRQSGTEPIIKVYAESPISKEDCEIILKFGVAITKKYFS